MINVTNNTNLKVFVYLTVNKDLLQIGVLDPGKCLVRDIQRGQFIEIKMAESLNDIVYPSKTIKVKEIKDNSIVLIR